MNPLTPVGVLAAVGMVALIVIAIKNWTKPPTLHFVAAAAFLNTTLLLVRIAEGALGTAGLHFVAAAVGVADCAARSRAS